MCYKQPNILRNGTISEPHHLQSTGSGKIIVINQTFSAGTLQTNTMKTKPVYQYVLRGFSYQPDGWHVSGQSEHAGAGVLEWCFSKEDAEDMIQHLQKAVKVKMWVEVYSEEEFGFVPVE